MLLTAYSVEPIALNPMTAPCTTPKPELDAWSHTPFPFDAVMNGKCVLAETVGDHSTAIECGTIVALVDGYADANDKKSVGDPTDGFGKFIPDPTGESTQLPVPLTTVARRRAVSSGRPPKFRNGTTSSGRATRRAISGRSPAGVQFHGSPFGALIIRRYGWSSSGIGVRVSSVSVAVALNAAPASLMMTGLR